MKSIPLRVAGVTAALLVLSGCAAGATPASTPAAEAPAPSASATPEPTAEPVTLRIEPDALVVLDGDEERARLLFAEPVDEALSTLADVFGAEPEEGELDGLQSPTAGTGYTWAGFVVSDPDGGPDGGIPYDWWVRVDAANSGDVAIESLGGLAVGDPLEAISSSVPDAEIDGERAAYLGNVPVGNGEPMTATAIRVWAIIGGGAITEFRAPSPNCCGT